GVPPRSPGEGPRRRGDAAAHGPPGGGWGGRRGGSSPYTPTPPAPASTAGLISPQVLVPALPVVQPRTLAPAAVVDGQVQQLQVDGPALAGRALEGLDPDAAPFGGHLAAAVRADSAAGAGSPVLRAAHPAHGTRDGERGA